jgi:hypothetical protein
MYGVPEVSAAASTGESDPITGSIVHVG